MKVLVACEESQRVCISFRERGFEAYSCDLLPCSGGHPEWHIQGNVLSLMSIGEYGLIKEYYTQDNKLHYIDKWDLIIAHPPCTYLAVCGNKYFNVDKYGFKAIKRRAERKEAIKFFMIFVNAPCKHIAIENPVGVMSTVYRKPDQIIQPWMFGESFSKKTCLWLSGLPKLKPTNIVEKGEIITFSSGKSMPKWYADLWGNSSERSKTFWGVARAMAEQWGDYLRECKEKIKGANDNEV